MFLGCVSQQRINLVTQNQPPKTTENLIRDIISKFQKYNFNKYFFYIFLCNQRYMDTIKRGTREYKFILGIDSHGKLNRIIYENVLAHINVATDLTNHEIVRYNVGDYVIILWF
jgi:hypothetical protein